MTVQQTLRTQEPQGPVKGPATGPPETGVVPTSNSEAQERLGGGIDLSGLLGEYLGQKVADKILEETSVEGLQGRVKDIVDAGVDELATLIKDGSEDHLDATIDAWTRKLTDRLSKEVTGWLEGPLKGTSQFLQAQGQDPLKVGLAALLLGAVAYAANVALPKVSSRFSVGPLKGRISGAFGKAQEPTLERIKAEVRTQLGPVQLRAAGETDNQEAWKASVDAFFKSENVEIGVRGAFDGDALRTFGFDSQFSNNLFSLNEATRGDALPDGVAFDPSIKEMRFANARDRLWNQTWTEGEQSVGKDALIGGYLTFGRYLEESDKDSAYEITPSDRAGLGLYYGERDFQAAFETLWESKAGSFTRGSADFQLDDKMVAGVDGTWSDRVDDKYWEVGGYYGFHDPASFQSFVGTYRYKSDIDEHRFGYILEDTLGSMFARVQQTVVLGDLGNELMTSAHVGTMLDEGLGLFAGVRHGWDFRDGHSLIPEVGVQIDNIPLAVGYDPENNGITFSISFPFGGGNRRASWR